MGSVTNWVIGREPIVVQGDVALVPLRVPWYRSLPLSSVETMAVSVNGSPVQEPRLRVNGQELGLAELAQRSDEFWFVQEPGYVAVPAEGLGDTAEVTAELTFRIPYIFVGPDTPMRRVVGETQTLDVTKEK